MVDTCLVTGTIVAPDGTPLRRTFMLFQRLPEEAFVADDATGLPTPVTKRTEDDGSIEVELIPGAYLVKQWYSRHDYFRIDVPDEPTARLEDIQDDILQPPPSEMVQAVSDARAARDLAEGYRNDAQAARTGAETARDFSQAARTGAEQARDAAQAARNAAENLYGDLDAVEQAKNTAVSARAGAETARDIAEGFASDIVSQGNVPIYASVETVQGLEIPAGITAFRTNGRLVPGDGGGGLYIEGASSDPGAFQSGDERWWVLSEREPAVEQFGTIQPTIDYALSLSEPIVRVGKEYPTPAEAVENRSNVVFRGRGRFEGVNDDTEFYRRHVIPDHAPAARAAPDPCELVVGKPGPINVVLVGDSLGTYAADAVSVTDTLAVRLEAKLRSDNPDRQINFYSRSIGGRTFAHLDGTPGDWAQYYPWYTDPERPWLEYVQDLSPDLVFLNFGMNDGANFNRIHLESVVSKLEAMPSAPGICFITNMAPNLSPHPAYGTFGTFAGQEGRDYVAGWVRSYARYHGYPLIDINRTFNMMRDGRDILTTRLVRQPAAVFPEPSAYAALPTQRCRDFSIRAQVHPDAWSNTDPFTLIGNGTNNVVFIQDVDGYLRFRFFRGESGSQYNGILSDIPTPTTEVEIEVGVRGSHFSFRVLPGNSALVGGTPALTVPIIWYGGLAQPRLAYFKGDWSDGPVTQATLFMGVDQPVVPTITDSELWGEVSADANTRANGGNGVNHPSSQGAAAIYGEHFSRQVYRIAQFKPTAPYSIGQSMYAQVDGVETIGFAETVPGERLLPSNGGGTVPEAQSPLLAGTTWRLLGAVRGEVPEARTSLWERVS